MGIESTAASIVAEGSLPDAVTVEPRPWASTVLRLRDPDPPDFADAGWDVYIHGDPVDDDDPVTVVTPGTAPNGLHRATAGDGSKTLWGEPSPRSYDVWSASSGALALAAPIGDAEDENAIGTAAEVTVTVDARELPLVVRGVISIDGCLVGIQEDAERQPLATVFAVITGTLTEFGEDPVVVAASRDMFHGAGGSTTIVLPAVSVPGVEDSTYTLRAELFVRYREDNEEAFDIDVDELLVGLQVIEYSSIEP